MLRYTVAFTLITIAIAVYIFKLTCNDYVFKYLAVRLRAFRGTCGLQSLQCVGTILKLVVLGRGLSLPSENMENLTRIGLYSAMLH